MFEQIRHYLLSCRELSRLCSQNGLIDGKSLYFQILEQDDTGVVASIEFDEIMEGSGDRICCFGQIRLALDDDGDIRGLEFL